MAATDLGEDGSQGRVLGDVEHLGPGHKHWGVVIDIGDVDDDGESEHVTPPPPEPLAHHSDGDPGPALLPEYRALIG